MQLLFRCILVALLVLAICSPVHGVLGTKHIAARKKANLAKKQQSLEATNTASKVTATNMAHKEKKTVSFALHHAKKSEEQQKSAIKHLQAHHKSFVAKKNASKEKKAAVAEKLKSKTTTKSIGSGNITSTLSLMNYYDVEWLAPITVGTPGQTFYVIFDTGTPIRGLRSSIYDLISYHAAYMVIGSTDLWLPSTDCTTSGCESQPQFDATLSSTYVAVGTEFSSSYGSGTLYGYSGMDTVTLGDLTVTNQTFGLIVSESGDWSSGGDPFDGLFGLAFTSISDMPTVTPFFQEVVDQGSLTENAVTFFFGHYDNEDAATITFGTPPVSQYTGSLTYLNITQQVYWQVTLVDIKVNGVLLNICDGVICDAILDTGTTLMTAPSKSLGTLLNAIGAYDDCSNWDTLPNVTFILGDAGGQYEFTLEQDYYMESFGEGECAPAFMSMDVADWENYWILGDYFMRKYMTVYHWGDATTGYQPRVGIALASG